MHYYLLFIIYNIVVNTRVYMRWFHFKLHTTYLYNSVRLVFESQIAFKYIIILSYNVSTHIVVTHYMINIIVRGKNEINLSMFRIRCARARVHDDAARVLGNIIQ